MQKDQQIRKEAILADWHVFMIASGGIIGAGLFVGTSAAISSAGPAVLLSYAFAACLTTIMMSMLYILYCHASHSKNFLHHLCIYLGPRLACMSGWLYVFLWSVTAAAQAVAGGIILDGVFHIKAAPWSLILMALGLCLNLLPVRVYGYSEALLSSVKIGILILFFLPCCYWILSHPSSGHIMWANIDGHGGFLPLGIAGVAGVIPMIMQDFTGCETAFLACQESNNPHKTMRFLTKYLPVFITLLYLACVLFTIAILPWNHVKSGTSPFSDALSYIGWTQAGAITKIMTLVAILSCLNSSQYVISRTFRSLADINCAPIKLAYRNRHGVPVFSVILGTITTFIPVFIACAAPAHFYALLLGTSGNMILIVWACICWAGANAAKQERHYKAYITGISTSLLMAGIFLAIILMPSTSSTGLSAAFVAAITWLATRLIPSAKISSSFS